jgi:hypothetical protein
VNQRKSPVSGVPPQTWRTWVGQQRAPTEQIGVGDSECREKSPARRPW